MAIRYFTMRRVDMNSVIVVRNKADEYFYNEADFLAVTMNPVGPSSCSLGWPQTESEALHAI
jgi:hypothetical protein